MAMTRAELEKCPKCGLPIENSQGKPIWHKCEKPAAAAAPPPAAPPATAAPAAPPPRVKDTPCPYCNRKFCDLHAVHIHMAQVHKGAKVEKTDADTQTAAAFPAFPAWSDSWSEKVQLEWLQGWKELVGSGKV